MELTGLAGEILGFLVIVVAYTVVIAGLWCVVWYVLLEIILERILSLLKFKKIFIQFIWHRKEFLRWLTNEQTPERSATTGDATLTDDDKQKNQ